MDIQYAKELLTTLADGINPLTGEVLSQNDSCNQPDIVRALYTALAELDKRPEKTKGLQPENAGKPWTPEDDERLKECFVSGMTQKELCNEFKRSSGSISSRLTRLGITHDL